MGAIGRKNDFLVPTPRFHVERKSQTWRHQIVVQILAPFARFAVRLEMDAGQRLDGAQVDEGLLFDVLAFGGSIEGRESSSRPVGDAEIVVPWKRE